MNTFYKYILCVMAVISTVSNSFSQASKIDSLLKELKTAKEDTSKVHTLLRLCWNSVSINTKIAESYGERSLALSKKIKYSKGEANSLMNLAICRMRTGETETALINLNQALAMFEKNKDEAGIYSCFINLGNFYKRQSEFPRSLSYYLKSLKIAEKNKDTAELAGCYNGLGLINSLQDKFDIAKDYYNKGLALSESSGKLVTVANIKMNLGGDYLNQHKYDSALSHFKGALTIFKKMDHKTEAANTISNIGIVYAIQKDYDKALEYCFMALRELELTGDKSSICIQYSTIAEIYLEKKDHTRSIEYFNKAIPLEKELNDLYSLKLSYENLAVLYSRVNDYKQAYHFHVLSSDLKDSVLNSENSRHMAEMNTRYETEKKDGQIKLLNKDREIQSQKTANDHRKQRTILFSVIAFLAFVMLFALFIYRSNRQKQKANEIITLQKQEVETAKEIIEKQKDLVEEKQKEILDSIHYAERIQHALLASENTLNENLNGPENYFVYFKPKDIVSGDFYWATEHGNKFFLAICDSTGHGVPGAFMSLLNMGFLSEAIKENNILRTEDIFNYVRKRLIESISKEGQKDGFDGILLCMETLPSPDGKGSGIRSVTYSAAHNKPVLISQNNFMELNCDKMPVGQGEKTDSFSGHTLSSQKGDCIYLYTDGYADQFGGPKGKKFKYKPLEEILLANSHLPLKQQSEILDQRFNEWKGDLEQVDDVLIIGIKMQ